MRTDRVPVDHIDVSPNRFRLVDTKKVEALACSMEALGLLTPITLYDGGPDQEGFDLVVGAHRLAAAKQLGWEFIDVYFTDAGEIDRQLWEIDENLMRSELTPTETAEHLAKRKELWGIRSLGGASCTTKKPQHEKQFAADTAETTGVNKSTINRAISRAEGVTQEVRDEIRGTDLDKGTVLDNLKKIEPEKQMEKLHEMKRAKAVKEPVTEDEVMHKQVNALLNAWNRAGVDARRLFLERVDQPIANSRYGD